MRCKHRWFTTKEERKENTKTYWFKCARCGQEVQASITAKTA